MSKKKERRPAPHAPPASGFASVRRYLGAGALVLALVGLGGAVAMFANQRNRPIVAPTLAPTKAVPPTATNTPAPAVTATPAPAVTPKPSVRVDRIKGNPAAKVTIVEYSDFQCPYCGVYATEVYPKLDERYIKTGKVRYIFRAVVLPQHRQAQKATEAAECAGDQGRFWEMHDMLFAKQSQWADKEGAVEVFKGYAQTLGLNEATFQGCLDSGKYADVPAENLADARKIGVTGTPTFLINNRLLPGAYPLEAFVQVIEEELAK